MPEYSAYKADEMMREDLWKDFDLALKANDTDTARKVNLHALSLGYDELASEMSKVMREHEDK